MSVNDNDTLDGGAGTDTLNMEINGAVSDKFVTSNIENVNVTTYGANTIDMKHMTGVKAITTTGSTNTLTLNHVGSGTMALGFSGATTNTIVANYTAGVLAGTSDVLTLNMNDAKAVTVTVDAGFESAKLNVTGANDLSAITASGISTYVLAGTGTLNAKAALTSVSTLDATGMTDALTTGTVNATTGFVNNAITSATTGATILLGSGADNIGFTNTADTTGSTVKLGAGNDKLVLNAAGANVAVFAGAGDDAVSVITSALTSGDIIDAGEGTDTVTLAGNVANDSMVLRGVENVTITAGTKTQTFTNDDSASAITFKAADNSSVDLANLHAGSTVKVDKASGFASGDAVDALSVGFASTEAAATINVNADIDGAVSTSKITAVTLDFAEKVGAATQSAYTTKDATSLAINAAKSMNITTVQSTDNKLTSVAISGSDAVTTTDIGAATTDKLATVNVSAAKALSVGSIGADSTLLTTVGLTSTGDAVTAKAIGSTTNANTLAVTMSAAKGITQTGLIDSTKMGDVSAITTAGSASVGAIGGDATTMGDVTITGATNAITTKIGSANLAKLGTVSLTATTGKAQFTSITANDTDGITVNASAKTKIDGNGTAATVKNKGGAITASLAGAAKAVVNYDGKVVNLTATNTGGLTSTIDNNSTAGDGATSTVSLGNAASGANNSLTFTGTVDNLNVTGGTGTDTVKIDAHTVKGGTIALGTGTDTIDFSTTADGVAVNLGSTTKTMSDTGSTTVGAGHAVKYDASSDSAKVVSDGFNFTVSGISKVVGTGNDDYIIANAEGTTITGGAGADTIIGGAGVDKIVFADTAAHNGADTITGFTAGSTTGDILNISAFLGAAIDTKAGHAAGDSLNVAIGDSLDYSTNAVNVIALNDIQSVTASNFGGAASATVIKTAASSSYFVMTDKVSDGDGTDNMYYVTTDGNNAATVTLVGTVDATIADLVDANFA